MNQALLITLLFAAAITTTTAVNLPHFFPNVSSVDPSLIPNTTAGAWEGFLKLTGCSKGQTVAGLSKIKTYFHQFGYISPTSPANFTDDFDDLLESAIKTYQTNFNLNPTGVLDAPTVKQIVIPRCGVADMINGTSTMNAGKSPAGEINTVGHYSFFPGSPRWPASKRDLTYGFFPENNLTDSVKMVFALAFERWSEVIPMTFTETSSYSAADIQIGFASGEHGDGEPFDGPLGTLAHAFSPPNGHFHLDGDENWVVDGDFSPSMLFSGVDLESVAVHEIGHLLGLGHSSVEGAIMFPSITSATRKVALAGDDVQGIQELYGSNPNYNGSSVPSSQQRDTNDGGGSHLGGRVGLVSLTVGLLVLTSLWN